MIYTTNVGTYSGNCTENASTKAKPANVAGYTLSTGRMVTIKFTYANTAVSPTLNITSTGAKPIYMNGMTIGSGVISAGDDVTFVYDGTRYNIVGKNYWFDAWQTWGINIEDGAVTNLMTPPGLKELVKNSSRLEHGKRYVIPSTGLAVPKYEERSIDIPLHLISRNTDDYFRKYKLFCDMVLVRGQFALWSKYIPHSIFRLVYQSCSNFNQAWRQMSLLTLKCNEPDPTDTETGEEGTPDGFNTLTI